MLSAIVKPSRRLGLGTAFFNPFLEQHHVLGHEVWVSWSVPLNRIRKTNQANGLAPKLVSRDVRHPFVGAVVYLDPVVAVTAPIGFEVSPVSLTVTTADAGLQFRHPTLDREVDKERRERARAGRMAMAQAASEHGLEQLPRFMQEIPQVQLLCRFRRGS